MWLAAGAPSTAHLLKQTQNLAYFVWREWGIDEKNVQPILDLRPTDVEPMSSATAAEAPASKREHKDERASQLQLPAVEQPKPGQPE